MKKLLLLIFFITSISFAQNKDEQMLKQIYTFSLTQSSCYNWLEDLCHKIGPRLSGSIGAEKAVVYTKRKLESLGLDRVYLQEVMVPKWERGEKEVGYIQDKDYRTIVPVCALGGSVATSENGLIAEVIEVHNFEELEKLGTDKIKGKIVFYNRPMEPDNIESFTSYGHSVDQRFAGAKEAAKYGAVGAIIRSMNLRLDDYPHTGMQSYGDLPKEMRIPTAAISTNGAELLHTKLSENNKLLFYLKMSCKEYEDVLSYNVIGEIKGTVSPEKIMVVGGHLDSWDLGEGTQDDGAGCVQSMEVLEIFSKLHYKPKNTIRTVLFMNEENGNRGGKKYEELSKKNNENHIFALESDSGGFTPRGFSIDSDNNSFEKIVAWKPLFEPYLIHSFVKGHSGTDIEPLTSTKIVKAGLKPDSQRYFDYHHAANDRFEAVNKRELELGAATMASLIYLLDQYGME